VSNDLGGQPDPAGALPGYPGGRAAGDAGPAGTEGQRLHPLSAFVRAGRGLIALIVLLAVSDATRGHFDVGSTIGEGAVIVVVIALGLISWAVTRWRVEGNVLRIDSGLIRRDSQRLPLTQIQAVDIVAPGVARVLGLAELRLRMAGSSGKGGRLAYLRVADAEQLRSRLLALAHGHDQDTPAPPEEALLRVPAGRLLGSIAISRSGGVVLVIVVGLIVLAAVAPGAIAPVIASGGSIIIAVLAAQWRRLNSGYNLTLAEAADGLHVRSGLIQTTAETIPLGRIQAARLVQPVLWQPLGWAQLLVDVAGKQKQSGENAAEGRQLRALLPVGRLSDAEALLARLMPGAPDERLAPPVKARWKSPLRYGKLSWGSNPAFVLTTSGRLRKVTDVVPLSKVQSIRRVEGPVQRGLSLASVHLDTAGRGIDATIRDREASDCDAIMQRLPEACRAARGRSPGLRHLAGSRP
jgi:putative membrane protein